MNVFTIVTPKPALDRAWSMRTDSKNLHLQCVTMTTSQKRLLRADNLPDQPWSALGPHHSAHRHSAPFRPSNLDPRIEQHCPCKHARNSHLLLRTSCRLACLAAVQMHELGPRHAVSMSHASHVRSTELVLPFRAFCTLQSNNGVKRPVSETCSCQLLVNLWHHCALLCCCNCLANQRAGTVSCSHLLSSGW